MRGLRTCADARRATVDQPSELLQPRDDAVRKSLEHMFAQARATLTSASWAQPSYSPWQAPSPSHPHTTATFSPANGFPLAQQQQQQQQTSPVAQQLLDAGPQEGAVRLGAAFQSVQHGASQTLHSMQNLLQQMQEERARLSVMSRAQPVE
jgi:hypothetical protein